MTPQPPRKAVLDTALLIDATIGWFLRRRSWSWESLKGTRVKFLANDQSVQTMIQYFSRARLTVSAYALAELSAAVERDIKDGRLGGEFYETMLLPLLAASGRVGLCERWRPLRDLLATPPLLRLALFGLPDLGALELASRLRLPLLTEDGRLAGPCAQSGIQTWSVARLLATSAATRPGP